MSAVYPETAQPENPAVPLEGPSPVHIEKETQLNPSNEAKPSNEPKINTAIPTDIFKALSSCIYMFLSFKIVKDLMLVEMFGYRYGKFDKVGDYSRVRQTNVEKYGVYPKSDTQLKKGSVPLFYLIKELEHREYKQTDCAHFCFVDPIKAVEPPSWKLLDPITGDTLLTIPRVATPRNYSFTIQGENKTVTLLLDRVSSFCFGDFRPGCEFCHRKIYKTEYLKTVSGNTINVRGSSLYGGMKILDSKGFVIYENYEFTSCDCLCCGGGGGGGCTGCARGNGEGNDNSSNKGGYYPGQKWRSPDDCYIFSCNCCCCEKEPFTNHTVSSRIKGVDDKESEAIIEETIMTDVMQADPSFNAYCTCVTFNGNMSYEEKIAVLLHIVDDRCDDEYDVGNMNCYKYTRPGFYYNCC